jgi:phosphatidylserine decarboxylase
VIRENKMPIATEGLKLIIPFAIFTILMFVLGWNILGFILLIITLFIAFFFRDPRREVPQGKSIVVSPADGKIVAVRDIIENDHLQQAVRQISIFLSIFNVHVNRVPVSGKIESFKYNPGKFHIAAFDKASLENEQTAMVISDGNTKILVKQIAGIIARRIACYVHPGDIVQKGERYGLIYFGSRVDIFLPPDAEIKVKMGDRVKGAINIIALLKE